MTRPRDVLRVLVVDDMSTSRGLMVRALETLGVSGVRSAPDGRAALRAALSDPPDLVLSDLVMPAMSGLDLLERLRTDERTRDARFILVTGRPREAALQIGRSPAPDAVLLKPFTVPQLQDRIEAVMGRI